MKVKINKDEFILLSRNNSALNVSKKLGISVSRVYQLLNKFKIKNLFVKKRDFNFASFEHIDSEEKAYWLGFLYADAYIQGKPRWRVVLELAKKDRSHITKWKKFLNIKNKIKFRKQKNTYLLSFGSKKTVLDLIKLGCFQGKSLTLKFPTKKQVPSKLLRHFLRGYIDGDGWFDINKIGVISSINFLNEMNLAIFNQLKLSRLGTISYKKDKNGDIKKWATLLFSRIDTLKILSYLYHNSNIYLNRKYKNYLKIKEIKNSSSI